MQKSSLGGVGGVGNVGGVGGVGNVGGVRQKMSRHGISLYLISKS